MIVETLKTYLVQALKSRETEKAGVLRYLLSKIKNKEIELRSQHVELNDEHVLKVIRKLIKTGTESAEGYKSGGRQDLVDKEEKEVAILKELEQEFSPKDEQ